MKSRFTYGMFAGFALACMFFFFFLFFFPNVFRNLTAKNSPNNYPVAAAPASVPYGNEYVAYKPPTAYYDAEYVAYIPQTAPVTPPAKQPSQSADWSPKAYDPPSSAWVVTVPINGVPNAPDMPYSQVHPNLVVYNDDPEGAPYYGRSPIVAISA